MPRLKKEESTGFAARLKELREAAGLTQDELAQKTGLNRFSVAKIEQGHREPNWPTVLRLAEALGVNVSAFVVAPSAGQASAPSEAEPNRRGRPTKRSDKQQPAPAETLPDQAQGKKPRGKGKRK